jgi:hypothetical protein
VWASTGDVATSYAPERQNITCRWFADGKDTFLATYKAIKAASTSIYITDWWMVGEVYLKRNPLKVKPYHRLDLLLNIYVRPRLSCIHHTHTHTHTHSRTR